MNPGFAKFRSRILNPVSYRLFLLSKLPMVWIAGIKLINLSTETCVTAVKYGWINQNPFRSMYFAVMQMAAELSTGALCMAHIYQSDPPVSMLVVKTEGVYHKKAVGKIRFTCNDGDLIATTIKTMLSTAEAQQVRCYSVALNELGENVAEFWITWSLKGRASRR